MMILLEPDQLLCHGDEILNFEQRWIPVNSAQLGAEVGDRVVKRLATWACSFCGSHEGSNVTWNLEYNHGKQ